MATMAGLWIILNQLSGGHLGGGAIVVFIMLAILGGIFSGNTQKSGN